jgi:hypothetical protein
MPCVDTPALDQFLERVQCAAIEELSHRTNRFRRIQQQIKRAGRDEIPDLGILGLA